MKKKILVLTIFLDVITSILYCMLSRQMHKVNFKAHILLNNTIKMLTKLVKFISTITVGDIIQLLMMIVLIVTLREMQIQRDQAYSPDLYIENSKVFFTKSSLRDEDSMIGESMNYNKYEDLANIEGNLKLSLKLTNVGMGVAKDVKLDWDHKNDDNLYNLLHNVNILPESDDFIKYYGIVDKTKRYSRFGVRSIIIEKTEYADGVPDQYWSFIRPNTDETIEIPMAYYIIIKALVNTPKYIEHNLALFNTRYIDLGSTLSYNDVQGKEYTYRVVFHFKLSYERFFFGKRDMLLYNIDVENIK